MILLAMNLEGYRNLCKLVTLSYTGGFYFKPRIDKELLAELNGGLIGTSAAFRVRSTARFRPATTTADARSRSST